jgi:hypothetical protein
MAFGDLNSLFHAMLIILVIMSNPLLRILALIRATRAIRVSWHVSTLIMSLLRQGLQECSCHGAHA